MTDERKSGLALIAGSAAGIITMALHPTGHDLLVPGHLESVARMGVAVHSLALASLPVLFLGAWGLSRRVGTSDRIALSAMVTYTFALIAVMNAAVVDGLVAPVLLRQMAAAAPSSTEMWHMVINYNWRQNQGFAQLYVAASSVAILLWSISILRSRTLARGVAIYGAVIAPITLLALLSGHLRLDTHGFGAVWFTQSIWFVTVGVMLWRAGEVQDSRA
jgi:hypothetical protein